MAKASDEAKEALFGATSSIWMLIASIVVTLNLIALVVDIVTSRSLGNFLEVLFALLTTIGFWITYSAGKKKQLSPKGITLIKVPFVIQFVFEVIAFAGVIILLGLLLLGSAFASGLASQMSSSSGSATAGITSGILIIAVAVVIVVFVVKCMYFSSVNKTLNIGLDISKDRSVAGRKAGLFAPVVMIISALCTFGLSLASYLLTATITSVASSILGELGGNFGFLTSMIARANAFTLVAAIVTFIASISSAVVMIIFRNKLKAANKAENK